MMHNSTILSFEEFTRQNGGESPETMGGDVQMGGGSQLELPAPAQKPIETEPEFDLTMMDEPTDQSATQVDNEQPAMPIDQMDDSGEDHSHL